jgi:hypothetical protein
MDTAMQKGKTNGKDKGKVQGRLLLNRQDDERFAELDWGRCEQSGNEQQESCLLLESPSSVRENRASLAQQPVRSSRLTPAREPVVRCKFHDGIVVSKVFSILSQHLGLEEIY